MPSYVVIGKILTSWGIKGEVKVLPLTFSIDRFGEVSAVIIKRDNLEELLHIEHYRPHGRTVIIKFSEVSTPEEAEKLKGLEMKIPQSESPPLPEGEYYYYQIIGLKVYTDRGDYIGRIKEIIEAGANDVYVIEGEKEYMVPAVEEFIKEVDIKAGKMVIQPIEGLLE